jgi:hypothetical protein
MAKIEAANALKRLTNHPQDHGFGLPPSDARVIAAEKFLAKEADKFDRIKALQELRAAEKFLAKEADKFDRIKALQELRAAAWQAASAALAACEGYLRHNVPGNCALEDAKEVEPKLNKGEAGLLDAIENRRRRCRELRADLARISAAPFPSSHAKAQMREIVEHAATRGAPSVSLLVEYDRREIGWPMTQLRSDVRGGEHPALAFAEVPDTVALFAWLHRDALIAALDVEIDTEADDKAALSHEARQKAEAEVQADLLAVERDEAALVWQAMAQSLPCEHRSDCSPVAILGVTLVTTPRADALPSTSPGQSWDLRR